MGSKGVPSLPMQFYPNFIDRVWVYAKSSEKNSPIFSQKVGSGSGWGI